MLNKTLRVEVDATTFPGKRVPARLAGRTITIDAKAALLMLGSLTIPGGFSVATPARYWAWVRYFSAFTRHRDLRIVGPFVDLDPHQKGILSDDFGVAFSTLWLYHRLGGWAEIVDGRKFLLQYSALVRHPPRKKPRKVGPEKCPDYVVRDLSGKWHVLECKATQTSIAYRDQQLKSALSQKRQIAVSSPIAGQRLAAGLFIGNDRNRDASHLRIIDPPTEDPLIVVEVDREEDAEASMRRLAIARAFGLAGMHELSEELSLPLEKEERLSHLYQPGERIRLERSPADRLTITRRALHARPHTHFQEGGSTYLGQRVTLDIPGNEFVESTGYSQITVQHGINADFVESSHGLISDIPQKIDDLAKPFLSSHGIQVKSQEADVSIRDGRLFVATLHLH